MKLSYDKNTSTSCTMEKKQHRVEMHLLSLNPHENSSQLYAVVMLSGQSKARASKHKLQGPFQSRDMATAVIRATIRALENEHYRLINSPLIWQLQAQTLINNNRSIRSKHKTKVEFTPLGVIPDSE